MIQPQQVPDLDLGWPWWRFEFTAKIKGLKLPPIVLRAIPDQREANAGFCN